jgi:hypothetical protein
MRKARAISYGGSFFLVSHRLSDAVPNIGVFYPLSLSQPQKAAPVSPPEGHEESENDAPHQVPEGDGGDDPLDERVVEAAFP